MHPRKMMRSTIHLTLLVAFLAMAPLIARAATPTEGFVPLGEAHSFKDAPTVTEWRFEDVRGTSPSTRSDSIMWRLEKSLPPIRSW